MDSVPVPVVGAEQIALAGLPVFGQQDVTPGDVAYMDDIGSAWIGELHGIEEIARYG